MSASSGIDEARLETDRMTVRVSSDGAAISAITARPRASSPVELLARTPWADDPTDRWRIEDSADEWHRRYPGGWHVLLPRALGPARVDGVEQPFHGEAAWRTWRLTQESERSCTATVTLRSVPLRLEREMSLEGDDEATTLGIRQRIVHLGDRDLRIGWVEHPAFDGALLADSDITLDGRSVSIVGTGSTSFEDRATAEGRLAIAHRPTGLRIALRWDERVFPRTYLWQERNGSAGFPWHRLVDAVGIEPATQRHDLPDGELGSLPIGPRATVESLLTLRVEG